jgi:general secretion pathway protein G
MTRANCPECGAEHSGAPDACPACGHPLGVEPRRVWPWVLVGCAVAAPVGTIAFGLLATLVVPNVVTKLSAAFQGKIRADLIAIDNALKEYAINNGGRYPDDFDVLVIPDENGYTYLDPTIPLDPWRRPYLYDPPQPGDPEPRVYTLGSDGVPGGEGDAADVDKRSLEKTR